MLVGLSKKTESIIVAVRHFSNRVLEFFVEIFMKDQRVRVICCALLFFCTDCHASVCGRY